jgi:hypothetical protein
MSGKEVRDQGEGRRERASAGGVTVAVELGLARIALRCAEIVLG